MKWYHERCPHFLKTMGTVRALRGPKWPEKTKVRLHVADPTKVVTGWGPMVQILREEWSQNGHIFLNSRDRNGS